MGLVWRERAKDSPRSWQSGGRQSRDPDRRQEGGAWEVGKMGRRTDFWDRQTRETTAISAYSSPNHRRRVRHALLIQLPCPCPSQCHRQQGLYLPTPNASSSQPQLIPSPCPLLFPPSDPPAPTSNATRLAATRVTFRWPRVHVRHPSMCLVLTKVTGKLHSLVVKPVSLRLCWARLESQELRFHIVCVS